MLFAATKADHVPEVQRDHLAALLRNMVALPSLDVTSSNAKIDVATLASVISTEEDTDVIDGHRVQVVVGKPVGSDTRSKFFIGNVPARPPRPEAWGQPFLNIPVFEPPIIDVSPVDGIAAYQSRPCARISHRRSIAMSKQGNSDEPNDTLGHRSLW